MSDGVSKVITLDMMLPVMSGVAVTEYVMAHCPTPILVVSASTNRGELYKTYDALAAGAVDVFEKASSNTAGSDWERGLVRAVKIVSRVRVITHIRGKLGPLGKIPVAPADLCSLGRHKFLAQEVGTAILEDLAESSSR